MSGNYFDTLGVRLVRGRAFTEAESRLDASGLVAVVSDRIWRTQFGGAEDVVGRSIVAQRPRGDDRRRGAAAVSRRLGRPRWAISGCRCCRTIAFTAPAATLRGSIATLGCRSSAGWRLAPRCRKPAPSSPRSPAAAGGVSRRRTGTGSVGVVPYSMTAGGDSLIATQAPRFLAIFSIVTALTLVIVCANVANLMLGRAVRAAAGAGLASDARRLALAGFSALLLAEGSDHLDRRVGRGVRLCAGGVERRAPFLSAKRAGRHLAPRSHAGLAGDRLRVCAGDSWERWRSPSRPAVRAWKQELLPSLRSGEPGVVAGRSRLSSVLVVVQMGFAVLLLTSAGLAYRSLSLLQSMDVGFKKDHLVLVNVVTSGSRGDEGREPRAARQTARAACARCHGIESVSYRSYFGREPVWVDGSPQPARCDDGLDRAGIFRDTRSHSARRPGIRAIPGQRALNGVAHHAAISQNRCGLATRRSARRSNSAGAGSRSKCVGVMPNGVFSRYQREPKASYVFRSLPRTDAAWPETFTFYIRYRGDSRNRRAGDLRAFLDVDNRVPVA